MKVFKLNTNVNIGENIIHISKTYDFINPSFYISINNKKEKIESIKNLDNTYKIILNIKINSNDIFLIIKDGLIEEYHQLLLDNNIKPIVEKLNLEITTIYNKDKITLTIHSDEFIKNTILNIEGDLNKSIIWRNSKQIETTFPFTIKGFTNLTFKINGELYKQKIYNRDDFPTNLIKIKDGFKLNKTCQWDLTVKNMNNIYTINKGDFYLNNTQLIDKCYVYIEDFLLFEQDLNFINYIPHISILENPLRAKLSQPLQIEVSFKIKDKWYIIKQNETEILLNIGVGLLNFKILEAKNATFDDKNYILYLK